MSEEKAAPEIEPQAPSPSAQLSNAQFHNPQFKDQRTQPPGVVAKQSQSYLIAGLSVVILLAVLFSKTHARPVAKKVSPASSASAAETEERNVERFQEDLTAKQLQVEAQRQGAANTNLPPGG